MLGAQVTWGHGPLVLNEHLSTSGVLDPSKVNDTIVLDRVVPQEQFRSMAEAYHLATGGALGRVHRGMAVWRIEGRIEVPDATQSARLADRRRQVRAAFDPALCLRDSPDTEGAYALSFYEPTADLVNWPTGFMPLRVYGRPLGDPLLPEVIDERGSQQFAVDLLLPDPRVYAQSENTVLLTPSSPTGNLVNPGTATAPVRLTITMAGAGAATFTISRGGVAFGLDLSGALANDVFVVVMETCAPYGRGRLILKNGADAFRLKTSAANTWLDAPAGTTTFTIANTLGITSCLVGTYGAWS